MMYGYARVSSRGQEVYGNSLEDQAKRLLEAGVAQANIYQDSYTGTKMDRPNFTRLLSKIKAGDTLVVTKLDRFARTAADGVTLIQELIKRGVIVNILNMGKADNTPMGKLLITVLLAFAEFERDMIVERTQAGKATAKAKNPEWREGRKPLAVEPAEFRNYFRQAQAHELTVAQCCERLNISRSSWYNLVRAQGMA